MEKEIKENFYLYCHFYIESSKGIINTIKVPVENFNLHIIDLKTKIEKLLEKNSSNPFKILSLNKTIESKSLLDSLKVSAFFNNKEDIFCQVELNIQPIKTIIKDDVLKYKSLTNYSFYVASKQIVKVMVPLKGIESLPKENLTSVFTESSLDIKINGLNGNNYCFGVPRLDAKIIPDKSEALISKDNLVIRLRKAKEDDHWSYLYKQRYVGEN